MRRLIRAVGLALVLIVAGCAAPAGPAGSPDGRDAEQVRAELQNTYDATWGGPRARRAAEVLAYVEQEERLAACLAQRGTGHMPAPFVDATARRPGPLSWYDALLPVDGEGELLVPVDEGTTQVVPERTWPGPPPTADDLGACVAGPPEVSAVDPVLDAELYDLVTATLGDATQVEGYQNCLAQAGFDAASRDELVDVVLAEREPDGGPGPRERDAVVVDARCRADAHRAAMAALDQPLRAFRVEHADALAALPGRAADLEQEAQEAADRMGLAISWW